MTVQISGNGAITGVNNIESVPAADVDFTPSGNISSTTVQGALNDIAGNSGASKIGYTPSGTGAVATTVQSKLRETVSVKDFGAKGDWNGTTGTDDTAAIKSALSLLSNGGTLLFPPGNYKITATEVDPIIVSASGVRIVGDGATITNASSRSIGVFKITGSRIVVESITFDGIDTSLNTLMIGDTANHVAVRDCEIKRFKQQSGDATYAVGILVQCGSSDVLIDNCHIHHIDASVTGIARGVLASGYGTAATHFTDLTVSNCLFEDITPSTDADAIVLQPDDLTADVNSNVINCRFVRCAKRAIKIQGNNCSVFGGHITLPSTGYAGISIYADRCKVFGTVITGGYAENGIEIGVTGQSYGNQTIIDGVTVSMTSQSFNDGIRIYGSPSNIFVSNCILSTLRMGIRNGSTGGKFIISGNSINNVTQYAIRNENNGTEWTVVGNVSDGTGSGSHGNLPTRSTYIGNQIAGQATQATGTSAPTSGTWNRGDIVWNGSGPNSFGQIGWYCTASGTPGTWRVLGVACERSTTANRPTKTTMGVANDSDWAGTMYFDNTLSANGKPIWWNGSAWVDATGAVV